MSLRLPSTKTNKTISSVSGHRNKRKPDYKKYSLQTARSCKEIVTCVSKEIWKVMIWVLSKLKRRQQLGRRQLKSRSCRVTGNEAHQLQVAFKLPFLWIGSSARLNKQVPARLAIRSIQTAASNMMNCPTCLEFVQATTIIITLQFNTDIHSG